MASAEAIQAREEAARRAWPALHPEEHYVNVGDTERLLSQLGGGLLLGLGLWRSGVRGLVMAGLGGALLYRGVTGHCPLYQALGASTAYEPGPADSVAARAGVRIEEVVTIDRPPEEVYRFFRDYANLPRFMKEVESVTPAGDDGRRSHWIVRGPLGTKLEWDAEIHTEEPGRLFSWRSLEGGDIDTAGSIHFDPAPGGRGTEVRINQKFDPPGGKLGLAVAKILGFDPRRQTRENLRRLKQLLEAGEIATTEGQPSGRG
ncbi:MAG: SRPBCC family protein [Isosphaeraceae bacterium]|nr:SRPBCC family protein [Isosphaeraceae bacterium]